MVAMEKRHRGERWVSNAGVGKAVLPGENMPEVHKGKFK
jgi:hypothetical protein